MYRKESGWLKHYDFVLLDMICLQIAFVLAYVLSGHGLRPYSTLEYRNMAIIVEIINLVAMFAFDTLKGVLKRGIYQEFKVTGQHAIVVIGFSAVYLFLIQNAQMYSRLAFILMSCFYFILTYIVRELWKKFLRTRMINGGDKPLLIVTHEDIAATVISKIKANNYARYKIAGLTILDKDLTGTMIAGVPVVADEKSAPMYVCQEWIDEVFVIPSEHKEPCSQELIDKLIETGVTLHQNLAEIPKFAEKKQFVEKVANYTVLTTSLNSATSRQLFAKRMMDILGGLVGCFFTAIIFIIIGPMIYISSPGPIFFAQERVGRNGKRFKIYKFRSMYMDAEARKAELMKENKMGDGKMFKMDFDPRVIGNRILPDGSKKTGIGNFIRVTSLDEFPQFFNVLKGDMSIVGTRPPLVGEVNLYELHHRARLAIKPGITGMWQISGRSDIVDFEEVVRLDREYITNWDIGLDIKILLKTVFVVFKKDGSV